MDQLHPNISYFKEKQLRQEITIGESKGLILETNVDNNDEHSRQQTAIYIDKNVEPNLENRMQGKEPNDANTDGNLLNDLILYFLNYRSIFKNLPLRERNFYT